MSKRKNVQAYVDNKEQVRLATQIAQRVAMLKGELKYEVVLTYIRENEVALPYNCTAERFAAMVIQEGRS